MSTTCCTTQVCMMFRLLPCVLVVWVSVVAVANSRYEWHRLSVSVDDEPNDVYDMLHNSGFTHSHR
jgi:hypothetical protein